MPTPTHLNDVPVPELDGVDAASWGVVRSLMRTVKVQRRLMSKLLGDACGQDVPPGQAMCLLALVANDGITQKELAELMQVARPTVTTMLHRMERSGVVERRADDDDRRLTRVYVTMAGRELEHDLRAVFSTYIEQTIGLMSAADRRDLVRLLGALSDNAARALDVAAARSESESAPREGSDR